MSDRPIADPRRTACLDGGWHATVCVADDGNEELWLLAPPADRGEPGCACHECAPHEQHGPPSAMYRCPATSATTGTRCRNRVRWRGQRCHWHEQVSS